MWILNIIIKRNYWTRKKACFKPLRFTLVLISDSVGRISHGTSIGTHPRHCQVLWEKTLSVNFLYSSKTKIIAAYFQPWAVSKFACPAVGLFEKDNTKSSFLDSLELFRQIIVKCIVLYWCLAHSTCNSVAKTALGLNKLFIYLFVFIHLNWENELFRQSISSSKAGQLSGEPSGIAPTIVQHPNM